MVVGGRGALLRAVGHGLQLPPIQRRPAQQSALVVQADRKSAQHVLPGPAQRPLQQSAFCEQLPCSAAQGAGDPPAGAAWPAGIEVTAGVSHTAAPAAAPRFRNCLRSIVRCPPSGSCPGTCPVVGAKPGFVTCCRNRSGIRRTRYNRGRPLSTRSGCSGYRVQGIHPAPRGSWTSWSVPAPATPPLRLLLLASGTAGGPCCVLAMP